MTDKNMKEWISLYNAMELLADKGFLSEQSKMECMSNLLWEIIGRMALELNSRADCEAAPARAKEE